MNRHVALLLSEVRGEYRASALPTVYRPERSCAASMNDRRPENPAMTSPLLPPHPLLGGGAAPPSAPAVTDEELRAAAEAFEAQFLTEMLGHAGLGAPRSAFGGGPGEEAFASLLVREHARLLVERGGIGLAERLFEAMKEGRA
ncbi:rod-binding protein [Rhodovulum sp. DZ06]|uniref:rod-binding protein n=1 Tax=Rhodovulum sp. DZ06 TaxID=3425126 RepID=UPI003D32EE5D